VKSENAPEGQDRLDLAEASATATAPDSTVPAAPALDLEQIYARYLGPIYRFLYRRVGNREDAEDLTAETFLKAFRHLDMSRSETSTVHWLYIVAGTVAADHWRRYYRHGTLVPYEDLQPDSEETASPPGRSDAERRVADTLACLPEQYRRVLELRFLLGYSVQETAQELGVTPGNAKVLQHRALAKAARLGSEPCPSSPGPQRRGRSRRSPCPGAAA
jgi:RNA polymerase sigma-70 factor (ECF subfamily)